MFYGKPEYAYRDGECDADCVILDRSIHNAIDRYALGLYNELGLEVVFRDIQAGRR